MSDSKNKSKTEKEVCTYQGETIKLALNEIFKTYGITPQKYHRGNFVGNHVQIFMANAKQICAHVAALFRSCEERRVLNNKREAMSDADIYNMMVFLVTY